MSGFTAKACLALLSVGLLLGGACSANAQAPAAPSPPAATTTPLLATEQTVIGQEIDYPDGEALITSGIVSLPVGGETGWHVHGAPMFAYVLEGELTVDYGSRGTRTYRAGDALVEAVDWPHNGRNTGTIAVRILTVYSGAEDVVNAAMVPGPATAPPQ